MSFFGFDTSGRSHNQGAPGFSQAHDPFAGLSGGGAGDDDALEFEDTYDGLGDQLDDADDAFNNDTFGGETVVTGTQERKVGTDFDFFGQTAKVADAIEEEGMRFSRQAPAPRASIPVPDVDPYATSSYYDYAQLSQKPVRTGYEKYHSAEPIPDLRVDQSIWGTGPKVASQPLIQPTSQPVPSASSRKIMSLEEVEAAMRAQPRQVQGQQPEQLFVPQPLPASSSNDQHQQPQAGHGQPVTILRRPQSSHLQPEVFPQSTPAPAEHAPPQPKQILQNPNRGSAEASRSPGHQFSLSQGGSVSHVPSGQGPSQLGNMTEEEKAAFLDQETKRAKRNHKIWLLSKDNGLMTPQDKNFITRIQLQQLVTATGDPAQAGTDSALFEDFYYQVYSHIRAGQRQNPSQPLSNFAQTYLFQTGGRHGGMRRHERRAENHFQRMEQQVQRAVEAAKNKPKNPQLVIAGSLGKISFSNAKTPKPLLNIKRTESESRPAPGKQSPPRATLDRKTILRNVEKVYSTLMKIEDHVRLIPPPLNEQSTSEDREKHQEWAGSLDAYNSKLWNELKVHERIGQTIPHPFVAFLSCAKGKKAIPRIFPHLNFEQRTTIITMIVFSLDQLDVVQGAVNQDGLSLNAEMRENVELFISAVMPSLMGYFVETGLDIVDGVLNLMASKLNVELVAKTRIGVSMLTLVLSRAMVIKQGGGGNPEQWENWDQTFEGLFNRLEPSLPNIFPSSINSGNDVYVWQLLAAMGVTASHDQQTRLVLAVKDRVLDTVALSKTLPPTMAAERLGSVNLFMRAIGLDVELLE